MGLITVPVHAPYSKFPDTHIIRSTPTSHRGVLKLENRQEDGLASPEITSDDMDSRLVQKMPGTFPLEGGGRERIRV